MSQIRLYARHLSSRGPCTLEFLISQFGGWGGAGVVGITPAPCVAVKVESLQSATGCCSLDTMASPPLGMLLCHRAGKYGAPLVNCGLM